MTRYTSTATEYRDLRMDEYDRYLGEDSGGSTLASLAIKHLVFLPACTLSRSGACSTFAVV